MFKQGDQLVSGLDSPVVVCVGVNEDGTINVLRQDGAGGIQFYQDPSHYRLMDSEGDSPMTMLLRTIGPDYQRNVRRALELAGIHFWEEEGARRDMAAFYVKQCDENKSNRAIQEYYEGLDARKE